MEDGEIINGRERYKGRLIWGEGVKNGRSDSGDIRADCVLFRLFNSWIDCYNCDSDYRI